MRAKALVRTVTKKKEPKKSEPKGEEKKVERRNGKEGVEVGGREPLVFGVVWWWERHFLLLPLRRRRLLFPTLPVPFRWVTSGIQRERKSRRRPRPPLLLFVPHRNALFFLTPSLSSGRHDGPPPPSPLLCSVRYPMDRSSLPIPPREKKPKGRPAVVVPTRRRPSFFGVTGISPQRSTFVPPRSPLFFPRGSHVCFVLWRTRVQA